MKPSPPVLFDFNPAEGPPGTPVVITGDNLEGLTTVKFGGHEAPSRGNALRPAVRVRLHTAGVETLDEVLEAEGLGVPTVLDEDRLSSSWNLFLPGRLIQPGTTVQAERIPAPGAGPAAPPLRFPEGDAPRALKVRTVPPIRVTFHPIRLEASAGSPVGDVTRANLEAWAEPLRRMLPVAHLEGVLGAEFRTREHCLDHRSVGELLFEMLREYDEGPPHPAGHGRPRRLGAGGKGTCGTSRKARGPSFGKTLRGRVRPSMRSSRAKVSRTAALLNGRPCAG
jgi:hypothetical protein